MTTSNKVIPKKNYLILITIILSVVVLSLISVKIYFSIKDKAMKTSYLSRTIGEIQYDELDNAMLEQGSNAFLYIGYTKSEKIYNLEVKLKKIIVNNNLQDEMFYYNATELMKDTNYIDKLNEKLNLTKKKITNLPVIIYYRDNEVIDLITSVSEKNIINDGDFTQLLEKYEIIN